MMNTNGYTYVPLRTIREVRSAEDAGHKIEFTAWKGEDRGWIESLMMIQPVDDDNIEWWLDVGSMRARVPSQYITIDPVDLQKLRDALDAAGSIDNSALPEWTKTLIREANEMIGTLASKNWTLGS